MSFAYTVTASFTDSAVADELIDWLVGGHLADVCEAGAQDAEVVQLDGTPVRIQVRYHFADREAFAAYERDHAERLRGEGRERFTAERGVSFERSTGLVIARHP